MAKKSVGSVSKEEFDEAMAKKSVGLRRKWTHLLGFDETNSPGNPSLAAS